MKKLIIVLSLFVSLNVFASPQENKTKEIMDYSELSISDNMSVFAGKINTDYYDENEGYSLGVIFYDDKDEDSYVGVGYTQSLSKFDLFSDEDANTLAVKDEDAVLFFMNYKF